MPVTGIVNKKDLSRTDNWTPEFHLSGAFQELKEKTGEEIIEIAEKSLSDSPTFVIEKALKILNSMAGTFDHRVIDTRNALSSNTYRKLVTSIKERKIPKCDREEKLVIAVSIYGVLNLYSRQEDLQREAKEEKEKLLEALTKINAFLLP